MEKQKNWAIVYGNDHTNSLGVVQALGREGVPVIAVLWGSKTGIVESSRYARKVIYGENAQACISIIAERCVQEDTAVIIPCTDEAAVVLEENAHLLQDKFRFQSVKNAKMKQLEDKQDQTAIAQKSGLFIPCSCIVESMADVPEDFPYPCLIKPVLSTEGTTSDILICEDHKALEERLAQILPRTGRLLLQQYIEKSSDYGVIGCRMTDGTVILPCIIDRPRIFPKNTGLGTLYVLDCLEDTQLAQGVRNYVEHIDFVGLFSLEFAKSVHDGNYYFIEANFRNDGENPCLVKAGYNVLYAHYCDMLGKAYPPCDEIRPLTTISEIRHLKSMYYGDISRKQWWKDIVSADAFMSLYKEDIKPFYTLVFRNFLYPRMAHRIKKIFGCKESS